MHRNAAAWCRGAWAADDAIRHAVAAGEMVWAARLIEQHFDAVYSLRGEGATLQRWLAALPIEVVRARPRLLVAQAWMAWPVAKLGRLKGFWMQPSALLRPPPRSRSSPRSIGRQACL